MGHISSIEMIFEKFSDSVTVSRELVNVEPELEAHATRFVKCQIIKLSSVSSDLVIFGKLSQS